jgi:single-stranded-DNA-specific exonuclease
MQEFENVWKLKKFDRQVSAQLAEDLSIATPISNILAGRGLKDVKEVEKFCKTDISALRNPFLLPDIRPVLARLNKAIDNNEKIFVWGDYDVDGITATSVVVTALRKMKANLVYKVPHRMEDGYDIKVHSVDEAIKAEAQLLFSVDCGIVAFETAEYAKTCGLDLIITDHHHPSEDGKIPDCIGVVNPNRDDPNYPGHLFTNDSNKDFVRYPFDALAGVGIAFKVMLALAKERGYDVREMIDELVEYVALGTVADVAPMLDENKAMVAYGCQRLSNTSKPGIQQLLKIAGVKEVDTFSIGFQLGPRINAIGRLADAGTALDLLLETSQTRAEKLAKELDNANRKRQLEQEKAVEDAIAYVEQNFDLPNTYILVLGQKEWHPGLIGLIAGKLVEKFNKPTLVCSFKDDGYAKGSCRSLRDFNILNALKSEKAWALFKKRSDGSTVCGGHAFAAGFELAIDNIPAMREALNEYASDIIGQLSEVKVIDFDSRIEPGDINEKVFGQLTRLSPFGSGNETPVFVCTKLKIVEAKTLTSGKHLKLKVSDPDSKQWINVNAWRKGYLAEYLKEGSLIDLAFTMSIDDWQGRKSLTLTTVDIKPHVT